MLKNLQLRRFGSIGFLLLLALPFVGTYTWLQMEKYAIRKDVKQQIIRGLDESSLVKLVFTHAEAKELLTWEHSKEFEFNGQLYDVVRQRVSASIVTYWCFPDHAETQLQKQLAFLTKKLFNHNPQQKERQSKSQTFYKNLFCHHVEWANQIEEENEIKYLFIKHKQFISPYLSNPSPPPRHV